MSFIYLENMKWYPHFYRRGEQTRDIARQGCPAIHRYARRRNNT